VVGLQGCGGVTGLWWGYRVVVGLQGCGGDLTDENHLQEISVGRRIILKRILGRGNSLRQRVLDLSGSGQGTSGWFL